MLALMFFLANGPINAFAFGKPRRNHIQIKMHIFRHIRQARAQRGQTKRPPAHHTHGNEYNSIVGASLLSRFTDYCSNIETLRFSRESKHYLRPRGGGSLWRERERRSFVHVWAIRHERILKKISLEWEVSTEFGPEWPSAAHSIRGQRVFILYLWHC